MFYSETTKSVIPRGQCTRLRIDPGDGSPVVDYQIEDGRVERRTLPPVAQVGATMEGQWERLTPEQLTDHVMANTVVAQWLARRLGIHALIRTCNPVLLIRAT